MGLGLYPSSVGRRASSVGPSVLRSTWVAPASEAKRSEESPHCGVCVAQRAASSARQAVHEKNVALRDVHPNDTRPTMQSAATVRSPHTEIESRFTRSVRFNRRAPSAVHQEADHVLDDESPPATLNRAARARGGPISSSRTSTCANMLITICDRRKRALTINLSCALAVAHVKRTLRFSATMRARKRALAPCCLTDFLVAGECAVFFFKIGSRYAPMPVARGRR